MPWWAFVSVAVFGGALLVGGVLLALAVARAFAGMRRVQALAAPVEDLVASIEALEARLGVVEERRARLEWRLAALARSRARLSVLQWALGDALGFAARVRGALPRK